MPDPHSRRQPFVTGPAGKPALAGGSVQFSLSHIEGYALIGLTRVRRHRRRPGARAAAAALRRAGARELIAAATGLAGKPLAGASPDACFLQAWCRIEAFAKAHGGGIGRTLADLGLRSGAPRTPAEIEVAAGAAAARRRLIVRDVPLGRGLYAAIALEKPPACGRKRFPPDRPGLERLLARRLPSRRRAG